MTNVIIKNYIFYKDFDTNRWYIDIPEFVGSIEELEMVCGADIMLDIMAQGETRINLTLSNEPLNINKDCTILTKIKDTSEIVGAEYNFGSWIGIEYNMNIWLCEVTEYVFGYLPEKIYVI